MGVGETSRPLMHDVHLSGAVADARDRAPPVRQSPISPGSPAPGSPAPSPPAPAPGSAAGINITWSRAPVARPKTNAPQAARIAPRAAPARRTFALHHA